MAQRRAHDSRSARSECGVTSEPVTLLDVADVSPTATTVVAAFEADVEPLPGGAQIHHIGATALPSGHTKGDVDVNVRVDEAHLAALVDLDRKSTRLNSSHLVISYAVFCLKKKQNNTTIS